MATETQPGDNEETLGEWPTLAPTGSERRGRRRWPWVLVVVAAVVAVLFWFLADDGSESTEVVSSERTFGEVVRTDLIAEDEYDGTLGRVAGGSIPAAVQGTVTELAQPGQVVGQGEVLYEIDRVPTVLLFGEVPMYRDLVSSESDVAIKARNRGTITWLPEAGTQIREGDVLFEVDGEPVVALYGTVPAYRAMADLRTNIVGDDVLQLEESLVALGFATPDEMTVDGEFTAATENAVEEFQESLGATVDGIVALGDVVFIEGPSEISTVDAVQLGDAVSDGMTVLTFAGDEPMTGDDVLQLERALDELGFGDAGLVVDGIFTAETKQSVMEFETSVGLDGDGRIVVGEVLFLPAAVRVADRLVSTGTRVNAGAPLLEVTGQDTVITVELPAADQGTMEEGMAVTVVLPDGTEAAATVTSVATVASVSANNTTVFEVEIVLDDATAAAGLDEAPVDVLVVSDSVEGVLAVPVAALLALAEGGYAVEVDLGGGSTSVVAVNPGFFADGLVEVESDVLDAGDRVVIP